MKKTLFLILLILNIFHVKSQIFENGTVSYKVSSITPFVTKDNKKYSPEMKNTINSFILSSKDVISILKFNKSSSIYEVDFNLLEQIGYLNMTRIIAGNDDTYYYNKESDEFLKLMRVKNDKFIVSANPIKWEILNEQRQIGNYLCIKAKKKVSQENKNDSNIVAWFCPTIPVPFGPSILRGLPGLVIEAEYAGAIFTVEKIEWSESKIDIDIPQGKIITQKEFNTIMSDRFDF